MFEKAVRMKLRFQFRGWCSVEDLWDLAVEDLDVIYRKLAREAREQSEESLLEVRDADNDVLDLKISIVKHVVSAKLAEAKGREEAALKAIKKQRLLEILAEKQEAGLRELDEEDLQKLIDEL